MKELPEDYFCPQCQTKATHDLTQRLSRELNMPPLYFVYMAIDMLIDAKCPSQLLKPLRDWAQTYLKNVDTLNPEETDKLKLLKWNQWATQSAQLDHNLREG